MGWTPTSMLLSPRRASTLADLLRLLAVWMAAVLLAQGCAAASARGEGPRHLHRPAAAHDLWAHEHRHGQAERHHHVVDDLSVVILAGAAFDDFDTAALALAAAFALMATQATPASAQVEGRVWREAAGWPPSSAPRARLLKPPRHG